MQKKYTVADILQFAIDKEAEGRDFYQTLANSSKKSVFKDLFQSLADEEQNHIEALQLEMMKIGHTVYDTKRPSLLDDKQNDVTAPENLSYTDILIMAIENEEQDFRLYAEIGTTIKNQECKEALYALAEEEVKHKLRLQTQYDQISDASNGT